MATPDLRARDPYDDTVERFCLGIAERGHRVLRVAVNTESEPWRVVSTGETSAGPLSGVRVLDLSSVLMGPAATRTLGDLGADVIFVESEKGDRNRTMGSGPAEGFSGISLNLLRNKRSIAVDLKHPRGRQAFLDIAATCDVVITNLRPDPLRRPVPGHPTSRAVLQDTGQRPTPCARHR